MNKEKNKSLTCERLKISAVFRKNEETFLHSPDKYSVYLHKAWVTMVWKLTK